MTKEEMVLLFLFMTEAEFLPTPTLKSKMGRFSGIVPEFFLLFGGENMMKLIDHYGGKVIRIPTEKEIIYIMERILYFYRTIILKEEPTDVRKELKLKVGVNKGVKVLTSGKLKDMLLSKRNFNSINKKSRYKHIFKLVEDLLERDVTLESEDILNGMQRTLLKIVT